MIDTPKAWKNIFDTELLEEIEKVGEIKHLEPEDKLLGSGKNVRFFPIVINGTLKVTRKDASGKEILLYYINENESCAMTFSCCMQVFPSQVSIEAEEESEVVIIPSAKMDEWMMNFPSWKSFMMNTVRSRFDELLSTLDQVVFQKLDERLINYLKEKSKATGSSLINLSHSQIAREMASSREVISRLLKKLENDKKVLLYRNQIKLLRAL